MKKHNKKMYWTKVWQRSDRNKPNVRLHKRRQKYSVQNMFDIEKILINIVFILKKYDGSKF